MENNQMESVFSDNQDNAAPVKKAWAKPNLIILSTVQTGTSLNVHEGSFTPHTSRIKTPSDGYGWHVHKKTGAAPAGTTWPNPMAFYHS